MANFPQKHESYPMTFTFTKTGSEKRECLNYSTYGVCGHAVAVSAYTSSLTLFLQLQKCRHSVDLLELSNFFFLINYLLPSRKVQ